MRFPPSPQFLMNAAAMGAEPVEVAFEELYLASPAGHRGWPGEPDHEHRRHQPR